MISFDSKGNAECWQADFSFEENDDMDPDDEIGLPASVHFKMKAETDLFMFAKNQIRVVSVSFSSSGNAFLVVSDDFFVRMFDFQSCKLIEEFNETLENVLHLRSV